MNQIPRISVSLPTLRRVGDATAQLLDSLRHLEEIKAASTESGTKNALTDELSRLFSVAEELTGAMRAAADSADRS